MYPVCVKRVEINAFRTLRIIERKNQCKRTKSLNILNLEK